MELKCPQCGKWMAVSQEELVIHDCQVVCPQCLAVCHYEGNALVVRNDSDAPYRYNVNVEPVQQETAKFCHKCGKQLPSGISFCPYCGADLNAPFDASQHAAEVPAPGVEPKPAEKPKTVKKETVPEAKTEDSKPQQQPAAHMQDKLRSMAPRYHSEHPRIHQNGSMPGLAFKIFAYTAIIVLLALLVYIIVAGSSIEMPM